MDYEGDRNVKMKSANLKLECGTEANLWEKMMKEVKLERFAGPFEQIPYEHIQSPVGLVPKGKNGDTRLIFHLSYPRGGNSKYVNANTPKTQMFRQVQRFATCY